MLLALSPATLRSQPESEDSIGFLPTEPGRVMWAGSTISQGTALFHVALYQPEIPPNTGNIIRLCANAGCRLHLIHPLGFQMDNKRLERAGLDYREWADIAEYPNWEAFRQQMEKRRIFACSTRGALCYDTPEYQQGDVFLFGPETRGLPPELIAALPAKQRIRIPMQPGNRSLNMSNAVAILVYEAWRQQKFSGGY